MSPPKITRRAFLKRAAVASVGVTVASSCSLRPMGQLPAYRSAAPFVMIDMPGPALDPVTRGLIERHGLRAMILFQRNVETSAQARALVDQLRALMGPEMLVGIDEEGGAVIRVLDLPMPPSAMCLGATRDADLARRVGAAVGRGLASLGVNWNFAPSLDVNSNPLNPVISDRSFGSDPTLVAELGLAWADGCMAEGVATCVKHFPGHGDTEVDSHLGLPVVDKPMQQLEQLELLPFRQAAAQRVPSFMTTHIVFPALDDENPATLSPAILTGLLRDDWGYDGVVVTDAMDMHAIADRYGSGDAAVRALHAGADVVMALGHGDVVPQAQTLASVDRAVQTDRLSADRQAASMRRLSALARTYPSAARPYAADQRAADEALMAEAWRRGLTAYRHPQRPAPGIRLVLVVAEGTKGGGASDRGLKGHELVERLQADFDVLPLYYDEAAPRTALPAVRAMDRQDATVVFATSGRSRPSDDLKALIEATAPDLHLAVWNPYAVLDVPAPALITYGFRPAALDAVADWMAGRIEAEGTLPIVLEVEG